MIICRRKLGVRGATLLLLIITLSGKSNKRLLLITGKSKVTPLLGALNRVFGLAPAEVRRRIYLSSILPKIIMVTENNDKPLFQRLPITIIPTHYDLTIQPHLDTFKFDGSVIIDLQIKEPTTSQDGSVQMDTEGERIKVNFSNKLEKGDYQLSLKFIGEVNNKMKGFYRCKYITPSGETRYAASTQFEPSDCRRAFPCWDEPNFKATFDVTMITPKQLLAISNMPVKSESEFKNDKSWTVTKFERTPVMSTYLVAFVVGEYDYVETKDSNGVSIKAYTPVGKKEHGRFALEVAAKVLPFYADYFGIKYPIAKADMIAIPDFAMGAMENWGLITYRETALLIDPKFSSMDQRQRVAIVVAHELAHQWFGNLVTMDWWTDLWLNEGFATWIEYLAVDKCFPEFDIWTQFIADTFASFLVPDALKSSHPIEVPIGHPAEIDEIFDAISYLKGSSVIRMLHDYIGDDAFRKGLHNYLKEYSYKNTITKNLWSHLAKASNKPVDEVMSSWTLQMGYPLITVHEQQLNKQRVLKLTQQRFICDGSNDDENLQWKVPITVVTKSQPKTVAQNVLMDEREITITLDNVNENDWIKLNQYSIGLYRVKYESKTLERLNEPISSKILSPQDRLMVQNDVAALCNAGHQSFVDYLKLLRAYKNEDNFTVNIVFCPPHSINMSFCSMLIVQVWKSIASNIEDLSTLLQYTNYFEEMKKYCRDIFSTIQQKLGWDVRPDESALLAMLRPLIIGIVGKCGDQAVIDEAKRRFKQHLAGDLIDPNIRKPVYALVSLYGDESTQEELKKLYKTADMMEEQSRLLRSLGQTRNPELIQKTLQFVFEGDNVRMQDSIAGLVGCVSSKIGRDIVWKFLKGNWTKLAERFGEKSSYLVYFVEYGLSDFADEEVSNDIKTFFDNANTPIVTRPINKVVETIHMRSEVLKRDSKAIEEFFRKNNV
ncbi:unnamed protein product [Didymodactylos carnosus]|uniref:Aminopeptidase n=1 Tax=Didymodactylos carnosus TaxID=1234261 RepID=A0A8S2D811_9BILA|nr:unnamed protein product [Didymodactylos carnosus]CAF3613667.1 unnamed protein product [Didymodactylos carnosus]